MAQLVNDAFPGSTLDAQWTTDHANGGTATVSGGNVTLSITSTAGSRARIRTAAATLADGDTLEFEIVSGDSFNVYMLLRDNTGSTAFVPCLGVISGDWRAYVYRDSTGGVPLTAGPSISSRPRARFLRSGANTVLCQTFNGTTWDTFETIDNTTASGAWTPSFSTARAELMCNDVSGVSGPSSLVVATVGSGASAPTITSISPTSGAVGTEVTMTGTNLTGATAATHGPTVAMTGLVVDSSTQARATIASGSPASGTIRITTPGGTAASSASFTITPIFTSLSISNPNTSYTFGVLLSPIVVTALDQFGATFTGTLADCSVESLTLPVGVIGTLTEPFVAGVATFDDLTAAAITSTRDLLASPRCANWLRVRVKNAAGTYVDVRSIGSADYQVAATVTRDQETPASFATVTLRSGTGATSIKPALTTAPLNASGRVLDVGRQFQIWTTVSDIGVFPPDIAYELVFEGRIDTIDDTDVSLIRFSGRDGMVAILDAVFGSTELYGSGGGGTAVETVIQSMLTTVLGSGVLTLSVPTSPAWGITNTPSYEVKIGTGLYAAIKQLTDQIGWRLAFNYPSNVATLQLLGPNRSPTTADWTIAASEVQSLQEVALSLEPIRNRVTVQYKDSSGVPQTPIVSESTASISSYGLRPMVVREDASSQIKDSTAATRMADAIRLDLALPLLSYTFTHQHAFWQILPGHVVDMLANSVHFDTTQRLAVARTVLTMENGGGRVAVSLRGSPASRGRSWLEIAGPTPTIDVSSTDTFASATFSSGGTLRINVIGPSTATSVKAAVSTSGAPSSSDVDSASGTLSSGSSMASLTTPAAYTVDTTVYVAARAYIGGVGGRVIQLVVNRDAEVGTVAVGPSLTVRTEFSDTLCTITYVGTGTITVADNGGAYGTAPSSPFTRSRAAAGTDTVYTVSLRAESSGQTITNDITIPPRSTVDTDTVTPDLDVAPVATPTNGGSVALHTEYVVTASNPKSGGSAPTITVTFNSAYLAVERWTGSVWAALASGDTLTSGARVRALRQPYGSRVLAVTFKASLTGGGSETIQRTVPNQDLQAPSVICTLIGSTATAKTYRITSTVGGLQVRYTGGSATKTAGLSAGTYGTEPQDYTFSRPAFQTGDGDALFECISGAGVGALTDADSVTIPEVGRDTIAGLCRLVTIAEDATTQTVRVSGSAPLYGASYYDGFTKLINAGGLAVSSVSVGSISAGATEYCAMSGTDGSYPSASYYNDYIITKGAIGSLPGRVVFGIVPQYSNFLPDNDSVDVQPVIAQVPGRIVVAAINESGADVTLRWNAYVASGSETTSTSDVTIAVYATPAGASEGSPTTPSVTYTSGAFQVTFTRTANSAYRVRLTLSPAIGNGTADTVADVTVPTYVSMTGSGTPRFSAVTINVPGSYGGMTCNFTPVDAPSGALYNATLVYSDDSAQKGFVAVSTGFALGRNGQGASGGIYTIERKASIRMSMTDSAGNELASRVSALTSFYEPP